MNRPHRWAWASVDPAAVTHNVELLADVASGAEVWAVVKADGYGHGATTVARAALRGGATRLCVALVQEALTLRANGIDAPILVLTQQPPEQLADAVEAGVDLVVYEADYLACVDDAARRGGVVVAAHLHLDTGMSRVGAPPASAVDLARAVEGAEHLRLAGVMTHLASADDLDEGGTDAQLDRFDEAIAALRAAGIDPGVVHAANSAATLAHPRARYDAVRAGIAIYGIAPSDQLDELSRHLRPAIALEARVSYVKDVAAGTRVSYGWRHECPEPTRLATLPVGYADGVPRRLGTGRDGSPGHDVLIGGRRCPIVGVVTMDQFVVDVGDAPVAVGDRVTLLGTDGEHTIGPNDWAAHLDTIGYEIVCAISKRIPRHPT